jgi:hypothetical protein
VFDELLQLDVFPKTRFQVVFACILKTANTWSSDHSSNAIALLSNTKVEPSSFAPGLELINEDSQLGVPDSTLVSWLLPDKSCHFTKLSPAEGTPDPVEK